MQKYGITLKLKRLSRKVEEVLEGSPLKNIYQWARPTVGGGGLRS